ncbi:hypothetical protein [Nocardia terpenica]|uniref:Uncharacterized protein n=1 Tax=Nocardia terpenica TaxID=455432 RepID=A0A164HG97_9NOCA|nr:hypothetical protein [Nocardia terpenica]KZM68488.1 hypothetical protein AWN90_11505 [Nocardia terpenica]NQE88561.1 hypothetical protein [Nocardia terpenica]
MDGKQIPMDLGVEIDAKTQAWLDWIAPERQEAQVQRFLEYAGLDAIPSEPWPEGAPELAKLSVVVTELFPTMETAMAPENSDTADMFLCFLGECFIKFTGAKWINAPWFGREYSFYDNINPSLEYGVSDTEGNTAYGLMIDIIEYGFSDTAEMLREYSDRYAKQQNTNQ